MNGLILEVVESLEMDPIGIFTGTVGAMLSLFVVNGTKFSWRKTALILLAGVGICGYSVSYLTKLLVSDGQTRELALIANVIVGFIASDALSSIKTAAPTATNFIIEKTLDLIRKILTIKFPNNDK